MLIYQFEASSVIKNRKRFYNPYLEIFSLFFIIKVGIK
jgi:hypothetical protein